MTLIWALWAMREPAQILVGLAPRLVLLLHVGLGWGSMAVMTLLPAGSVWLLVLVLVVSSGDIGAYFGGRYFKGSKLLEPVSPGKTWSGAAVGLLASVGVAVLVVPLVRWGQDGALASAVYGVAAAIAAQVGDLLKSTLKRVAGVKDSGNILPGHGGLYDRIDGLLAAAPIALFLMVLP
jgi:phosphatidate cytidylyltransferase